MSAVSNVVHEKFLDYNGGGTVLDVTDCECTFVCKATGPACYLFLTYSCLHTLA